MALLPSLYKEAKFIIVALLILIVISEIALTGKWISIKYSIGLLVAVLTGSVFIAYGVTVNGAIEYKLIEMYMITPIAAVLLSTIVKREKDLIILYNILIVITFIVVVYDAAYILGRLYILPSWMRFKSEIAGSFVVEGGKVETRITNHSSLMYLLPMSICGGVVLRHKYLLLSVLQYTTIAIGLFVTILSGRRALQLVVLLGVALSIILHGLLFVRTKRSRIHNFFIFAIAIIAGLIIVNQILSSMLQIENYSNTIINGFVSAFETDSGSSGEVRRIQTAYLLSGWADSPLWGHGIGSYSREYIRSYQTPWSYEMVYVSILYQVGIIGIIIYFGLVFGICRVILKKCKLSSKLRPYLVPFFVGFMCFIIAGATNPMVFYLWAWAIILACVNVKIEK